MLAAVSTRQRAMQSGHAPPLPAAMAMVRTSSANFLNDASFSPSQFLCQSFLAPYARALADEQLLYSDWCCRDGDLADAGELDPQAGAVRQTCSRCSSLRRRGFGLGGSPLYA